MPSLRLNCATALLLTLAAPARAQATRTWVSGVGDDANPCSRTAPCKTFAGAISKTLVNGEIDALDPGGFGSVTITKGMTLEGGSRLSGVLVSGTNGINVTGLGAGTVVVLRNLAINGLGTGISGIKFTGPGLLVVEHCIISGFATGVELAGAGCQLELNDVRVHGGAAGVKADSGATGLAASLDRVIVVGATSGIDAAAGTLAITRSVFSQCAVGVLAEGGTVSVAHSTLGGNSVAAFQALSGAIRASDNDIFDNAAGFAGVAASLFSGGDNRSAGNGAGTVPAGTVPLQ